MWTIAWLVNIISGCLFFAVSWMASAKFGGSGWLNMLSGFVGVVAWVAIYVGWGLRKVRGINFMVIERFGVRYRVRLAGLTILCLPPFIDTIAPNGGEYDFEYHTIPIKPETPENEIDFKNGGTGAIVGAITYRVIPDQGNVGPMQWTYAFKETEKFILNAVLTALRHEVQKKTVDDACENMDNISQTGRESDTLKKALAGMGVEFHPEEGVMITDIRLSPETIKARQGVQSATQELKEAEIKIQIQDKLGKGYSSAIGALLSEMKTLDPSATLERAIQVFQTAEGYKMLAGKSGDINFVAPDMNGILASIQIGKTKP